MPKINVLVAEKSSHSRLVLAEILQADKTIAFLGAAADGDALLEAVQVHKPDVLLIDQELPQNENLLVLKRIFSESPLPVVLLLRRSALTLELMKQATELGAYAIVLKPEKGRFTDYRSIAAELLQKIRTVRFAHPWSAKQRLWMLKEVLPDLATTAERKNRSKTAETVVVIGASTGGTQAIETIVRHLKPDLKASVLVAIHLPKAFTRSYAERLKAITPLRVVEGREGLALRPGKIIIAPGGRDMVVQHTMGDLNNLKIGFATEPSGSFDQPSVDLLMQTLADSAVTNVVGVLLTGMGKDGTMGAKSIKARGGYVIGQDEATSVIYGMARSAISAGFVDKVLPLSEIAPFINQLAPQQVSETDMKA